MSAKATHVNVLCVDTSTPLLILALVETGEAAGDARRRAQLAVRTERRHGEVILGHVDTLLGLAGLSLRDGSLGAVAATLGPGGFTALRVGLSTAKGICLAHDLPLYGVGSLTVLAHGAPGTTRFVAPVIGAYKGEVFAAVYERAEDGALTEVLGAFHAPPEEAHARLRAVAPEGLGYVGPGARKHEVFRDAPLAPPVHDLPSGAGLAAAVVARMQDAPDDLALLEPHYVRPSDAVKPKGLA